jgi:uncharacterized protein (DUF2249 family)
MKKFITQTALLLALGMGVCSTVAAKPIRFHMRSSHMRSSSYEQVSFIPLQTKKGFAVMVDKLQPGNSMVIIYDQYKNVVFKDRLTKNTRAEKKYILSNLDNGDYTVEVFSKTHDIKTSFYVWDNGKRKIVHMI